MARDPRSALQAGLAALLAVALVALALLTEPGAALQLKGDTVVRFVFKSTGGNRGYFFDSACKAVNTSSWPTGDFDTQILWGAKSGAPRCSSISFYSTPASTNCTGSAYMTKNRLDSPRKWSLSQLQTFMKCAGLFLFTAAV